MSNITVGCKVRVVSGGRYLGKEGIVSDIIGGNRNTAVVAGSFPRSQNKVEQNFTLTDLKLLELPPGVVEIPRSEIANEGTILPGDMVFVKPSGGQHTRSTPLPTKADDAELEVLGKSMSPEESKQFWGKHADLAPVKKEGEQSRPFTAPVAAPSASKSATPSVGGFGLDARLAARAASVAAVQDDSPHLIVRARAGTGKTTTLVHGVRRVLGLESDLIPSPQQQAVWDAMELSKGRVKTIAFCAFNKSIAEELKKRLPAGCEAATLHSLGFRVVKNAFGKVVSVNQYRVQNIISELKGKDVYDIRRDEGPLMSVCDRLVSLCKMNLTDPTMEELSGLISHYDIDTDGIRNIGEVFDLVPKVLEACKDVRRDNAIDYDDMIWLPVVLNLPVVPYDLIVGDEAQDFNRCQQKLIRMYGRRLVLCGDDRQAIYGFAGADCDSLPRMGRELGETERGCVELPLTVTRRCGKAIVEEAKRIVPDFEAFENNPEGVVSSASYPSKSVPTDKSFMGRTADGDMVLCRCNAPLVSTCFKFLRAGRKAQIQGRDIGQGLISTIKKLKAVAVTDLQSKLDRWLHNEKAKENAKRNPSEDRLIALDDRYDCLCAFMENSQTVDEVIRKIESVFTDQKDRPGVRLSSIHRAKGLEADRVFLLQLKKACVPHPMSKTEWGKGQEMNLKYVAVTRAIHELVIVTGSDD